MVRDSCSWTLKRSCSLALLAALLLAGCGGGTAGGSLVPAATASNTGSGKAITDCFELSEPGPATVAGLGLSVTARGGQVIVSVVATAQRQYDAVLFELNYDATRYTPQVVQATEAYAPLSDSLCIEMLAVPGVVSFGQVALDSDMKSVAAGAVLAEVLFTAADGTAISRAASAVPVHSGALCPLTYDTASGELKLHYVNPGDYDQNGVVSVSDLVPLGRHFGESGPFPFESALAIVDGNNNGEIEVADLTIIGQNWGHNVERFNFYASNDISDVPVGYAAPSTIEPLGSAAFQAALGDPLTERRWFSFLRDTLDYYEIYWARPGVGATEGVCSNLAGPNMVTQPGSVSNALPSARLALTYGEPVAPVLATLDASASSDLDGVIAFYEWDFEGDSLYDAFGTDPVVTHSYSQAGTFAPLVRVTDNLAGWAIARAEPFTVTAVVAPNIPPTADIFATTTTGIAPLSVGFMATGSSDSDGYIAQYEWDFDGDGTYDLDSGSDPTVINTYSTAGTFNAAVRVTDDRGDSAVDSVAIFVADPPPPNEPPLAVLTADPLYGDAPLTVTLDAGGSYDPDGSIVKYEWDFDGDGNYEEYGTNPVAEYTFVDPDVYPATVRVTDDGGESSIFPAEVRVNEQLANHTPWPMNEHDKRHTRRSPYTGPQSNNIKWEFIIGLDLSSAAAVAPDATIYAGSRDGNLYAINPDKSIKWEYAMEDYSWGVAPAVAPDGSHCLTSCTDGRIYCINSDGTLRWSYLTGKPNTRSQVICNDGSAVVSCLGYEQSSNPGFLYVINQDGSLKWSHSFDDSTISAAAVASDGSVYVSADDNTLYAFYPDGSGKWTINTPGYRWTGPIVGTDGTVYAGSTSYETGGDCWLFAINPDGSTQWTRDTDGPMYPDPVISPDGFICYRSSSDGTLNAVNPDGSLKWSFVYYSRAGTHVFDADSNLYFIQGWETLTKVDANGNLLWSMPTVYSAQIPALGPDNHVYITGSDGGMDAFDSSGNRLWGYASDSRIYWTPVIDANDTVYFCGVNGVLYAVDPDGTLKWEFNDDSGKVGGPTIGIDGLIYVSYADNQLLALDSEGNNAWSYTFPSYPSVAAIDTDGTIFVRTRDILYLLDHDGTLKEQVNTPLMKTAPSIGSDNTLYFGGNITEVGWNKAFAVTPNGDTVWTYTLEPFKANFTGVLDDGTILLETDDSELHALNPDGSLNWLRKMLHAPALGPGCTVYAWGTDENFYFLDHLGNTIWSYHAPGVTLIAPPTIDAEGTAYLAHGQGIFAVNVEGSLLWSYIAGDKVTAPAIGSDGTLYVGCTDGRLYAFGPAE